MNFSRSLRILFALFALAAVAATSRVGAVAAAPRDYADVSASDWYYSSVGYCTEARLMGGTGDTRFLPEMGATRAMAVATLYRLEGQPGMGGGKSGTFIDVPESVWYTDAVEWAAAQEIVMGYGDGTFGPEDEISREQLAAMLYRYAGHRGYDVSAPEEPGDTPFTDASDISGYAVPAMRWAVERGILTGRAADALAPRQTATRAELAAVLMRFDTGFVVEAEAD